MMTDNKIIKDGTGNRGEYVKRIVNAVNYKGYEDHEDVWSILWEYQKENYDIINRQKEEIERLQKHIQEGIDLAKQIPEMVALAQTEAIKEFTDRVKRYVDVGRLRPPTEKCFSELDVVNMIDHLVKEWWVMCDA